MPEYTATEIDEPDDWIVLEELMRRHVLSKNHKKDYKDIRLFLSDVDGTLTDGGMYYSENGDELKKFNTRDGMGMNMLQNAGVKTGIVTSEDRKLNQRRAEKLNLDYFCQGKANGGKLDVVNVIVEELGISLANVAYIGDDVNCLQLLSAVGFAACPSDASPIVKGIPNIKVMKNKGGAGCVREFCDEILRGRQQ